MKPKVALVKDGFLPAGSENTRGRMSKAMIARCEYLVSEKNWDIDGFVKSTVRPKSETEKSEPEVKRVAVTNEKVIADLPPETHNENEYQPFVHVDGKAQKVGKRTVCTTCGNSLTHCWCGDPQVWVKMGSAKAPVWFEKIG